MEVEVDEKPKTAPRGHRRLTNKMFLFAAEVAKGTTCTAAYRKLYSPHAKEKTANEEGCKLAAHPAIRAEIDRIRAKASMKTILSLNDRFKILARIAQDPEIPAGVQVRSIDVYNRMAGDEAPQRMELTGKDGAPLETNVNLAVRPMSARERLEAIKAARAAKGA